RKEPRVSCRRFATLFLLEQRLQGGAPAGAQCRDVQCTHQLTAGVTGHVQQGIDLEDSHALGTGCDLYDHVAGFHLACLQNTEIETGSAMCDQQRGHLWLVHADAHAVTSYARLCHFKQSAANPITVADAHLVVGQAVDREVLSELSIGEIVSTEFALPIMIGVDLIDEDGAVLTAVPSQVPLAVAIDIESPDHAPALNGCLPNGGVDGLPSPRDIPWQTHVDRKQACRHSLLPR